MSWIKLYLSVFIQWIKSFFVKPIAPLEVFTPAEIELILEKSPILESPPLEIIEPEVIAEVPPLETQEELRSLIHKAYSIAPITAFFGGVNLSTGASFVSYTGTGTRIGCARIGSRWIG